MRLHRLLRIECRHVVVRSRDAVSTMVRRTRSLHDVIRTSM